MFKYNETLYLTRCRTPFKLHIQKYFCLLINIKCYLFFFNFVKPNPLYFSTLYEHVLEWRPGIRHVPLLATLTQRGGNTIGEVQTTTFLYRERYRQINELKTFNYLLLYRFISCVQLWFVPKSHRFRTDVVIHIVRIIENDNTAEVTYFLIQCNPVASL